jgi:DNA protecting protein DprA
MVGGRTDRGEWARRPWEARQGFFGLRLVCALRTADDRCRPAGAALLAQPAARAADACEMTAPASLVLEGVALPHELRELPAPPARMFVRGQIPRGPRIAVVGTREPSPDAEAYARQLAFDLARAGVAVVSGGALGIDAAAHAGALEAGGLSMIVAPSSLEHPYPAEHGQLFEAIVGAGGAHVSPFATGALPRRHQFFLRNACLVALSHALVMVEAPRRRGARPAGRGGGR